MPVIHQLLHRRHLSLTDRTMDTGHVTRTPSSLFETFGRRLDPKCLLYTSETLKRIPILHGFDIDNEEVQKLIRIKI